MSSSQKFGAKKEEDDARLGHIEEILPLLVRLEEYLRLKDFVREQGDQISTLISTVFSLSEKLAEQTKQSELLEKQLRSFQSQEMKDREMFILEMEDLRHFLESIACEIELLKEVETDSNDHIIALKEQMDSLPTPQEVQALSKANSLIRSGLSAASKEMQEIKENVRSSKDYINALQITCEDFSSRFAASEDRFKEMQGLIQGVNRNMVDWAKRMVDKMMDSQEAIRSEFTVKISSIKVPEAPLSLSDVKREISSSIEIVSMDARNAVTRTGNSDLKITLLEKKVEQISLSLKRYELLQ